MMKKIIILILTYLLLVMCAFTGCKSGNISPESSPITISILYNDVADNPFNIDWRILQEYKKNQNVTLDVRLGSNEDYEKAIELNLNSSNPPDVILKCWPGAIESYANEGKLLSISDYEEFMPYFMAYIEKNGLQSEIDKLKLDNGKYYILPGYQREIQVQQWIFRQDAFEDNNIKTPETYDELFDSLSILKEIYPDSTPITASWGGAHLFSMMGAGYGIPGGWSGTRFYDYEEDKWLFAPATENYKEMYRFLNRCYKAGILDPELFNQSDAEFYEKIGNGKALVTVSWITSGFDNWNGQLQANGIANGKWAALPVLESTWGIKALPSVDKFRKGLVVSADVSDKPYFEELMKFLDWAIYSDEGMELTTWGIEGITYEKIDSTKMFLLNIKTPKNPEGTLEASKEYGLDLFFNLNENEEFEDYKKPDDIVEFLLKSEKANETLKLSPNLKLNSNEIEMIAIVEETLLPYVNESSYKFITGELSVEYDWDAYLTEMDNRGYTILEQIWKDAWERQTNP